MAALALCLLGAREVHAQLPGGHDDPSPVEEERPRHGGRALLETSGLLLGGTIRYWRNLDFNSRDWDLEWSGQSWRRKLSLQAVRFDQNLFATNTVRHAAAGVAHYQVARGNGFGMAASAVTTLATSLFWEYLVEFREYPSLNDLVTNAVGGVAIGEPLYRLGELLLRSPPRWWSRGLAALVSPVATFNDWVDRRERPGQAWVRSPARRFRLDAGLAHQRYDGAGARPLVGLGLEAALVTLPGYGRAIHSARWSQPGDWSGLQLRAEVGADGLSGFSFQSRTSWLGWYRQNFSASGDGALAGRGVFLGLGSAFEYERLQRPGGDDYLAVLDVAGPVFELVARRGPLALRWSGQLYGAFAMINALAFADRVRPLREDGVFRPAQNGGRLPGVLGARGYYYAIGLSGGTRLDLDLGGWSAGGELRGDDLGSVRGRDRFLEEMQEEYEIEDERASGQIWLALPVLASAARLSSSLTWRWRRGQSEGLTSSFLDRRFDLSLSLRF